jgi:hypothetical protein
MGIVEELLEVLNQQMATLVTRPLSNLNRNELAAFRKRKRRISALRTALKKMVPQQ